MKSILLIALFMVISCKTSEVSYDVVSFYKCLLIESNTVFNHINSLIEAIETLDPLKLIASFTTIYPAIVIEVTRCELLVKKNVDNEIVFLSFLGKDILPVHDILLGNLVLYVSDLVLVDGYSVSNGHLPGFALGREDLGLDCQEVQDVARKLSPGHVKGGDTTENSEESLLVQLAELVGSGVSE